MILYVFDLIYHLNMSASRQIVTSLVYEVSRNLATLFLALALYARAHSTPMACLRQARAQVDKLEELEHELERLQRKLSDSDRVAERISYKLACERRRKSTLDETGAQKVERME